MTYLNIFARTHFVYKLTSQFSNQQCVSSLRLYFYKKNLTNTKIMMSTNMFALFFILGVTGVMSAITSGFDQPVAEHEGPCLCAVFGDQEVEENAEPILKQQPMNVTCNVAGEETCLKMCTALAVAAKARGPTLLCASIQHVVNLKASVFTRVCENPKWNYTGLSCPEPICCHEGEPVPCKNNNVAETKSTEPTNNDKVADVPTEEPEKSLVLDKTPENIFQQSRMNKKKDGFPVLQ